MSITTILMLGGAYLLGSIPFGLLIARWTGGGDIRHQGSGNIGATNVLRTAGKAAGAATLVLDMGKGALAILAAQRLGLSESGMAAIGLTAFAGHLFPLFLGFRGGKGVAIAFGIFLAWTPWVGLLSLLVWLGTFWGFNISSLSALAAFAVLPVALFLQVRLGPAFLAGCVVALFIFWRHRDNIQRLLNGTEPRIGRRKRIKS
jgi:glycerol-3-phosphate acyltransferase PlsY